MTSLTELLSEGPIGNVICKHLPKEFLCNVATVSKKTCDTVTRYLKFRFGQKYDFDTFNKIKSEDYGFWVSMTVTFGIAKGDLVEAMFLMDDSDIDVFKVCVEECIARGMEICEIKRKSPMCDEESDIDRLARKDRIIKYHNAMRWGGLDNLVVHLMLHNRCVLYDYLQETYEDILPANYRIIGILKRLIERQCDEMLSKFSLDLVKEPKSGLERQMHREIFSDCSKFSQLPLTLTKIAPLVSISIKTQLIGDFTENRDHDSIDIMVKFGNLNSHEKASIELFYKCIEQGNYSAI